jgi:alkylated DNA repair dioxygenase AlkB
VKLPLSSPTLSPADLAAALRADLPSAPLARGRRNAFKEAEARFRAVVGEEDAVAAGAVDFGATGSWRGDASVAAALGIVTLCPPAAADSLSAAAGAEGAGCFAPSGGIYGLAHAPGFYHLPASLTAGQQAYWIRRILRGYVEPPNRRNIDAAADPDYSNLVRDGLVEDGATSTAAAGGAVAAVAAAPGSASAGGDAGGGDRFRRGLWPEYVAAADGGRGRDAPTLAGVSWATLGFQYDWTSRVYHLSSDPDYALHAQVHASGAGDRAAEEGEGGRADRWCTPFPADMWWLGHDVAACIHKHAAAALPAALPAEVRPGEWNDDAAFAWGLPMSLDAQSGICNLYPATKRLPMGAHVDNMERDYAFPVVSLSLGCTGACERTGRRGGGGGRGGGGRMCRVGGPAAVAPARTACRG